MFKLFMNRYIKPQATTIQFEIICKEHVKCKPLHFPKRSIFLSSYRLIWHITLYIHCIPPLSRNMFKHKPTKTFLRSIESLIIIF